MSFLTAKAQIETLITDRLNLMRFDRCFNGLTFQNIDVLKESLKKVDTPVSFALFITTYWSVIKLLPPVLDSAQRSEIKLMHEKAKNLLNPQS